MSRGKCKNCGATLVNTSRRYSACATAFGCSRLNPRITPADALEWEFTQEEIRGLVFDARETETYERLLRVSKLPVATTMPGPRGGAIWKHQGESLYHIEGLGGLYIRRTQGPVEAARSAGADQWGNERMAIGRFVKTNVVQWKLEAKGSDA